MGKKNRKKGGDFHKRHLIYAIFSGEMKEKQKKVVRFSPGHLTQWHFIGRHKQGNIITR